MRRVGVVRGVNGIGDARRMVANLHLGVVAIPAGWRALVGGEERYVAGVGACTDLHIGAEGHLALMVRAGEIAAEGACAAAVATPGDDCTTIDLDYAAIAIGCSADAGG